MLTRYLSKMHMETLKVKVCGLNKKQNILDVIAAGADLIGLIFFDKSPRSVEKGDVDKSFIRELSIKKVGVFVNATEDQVVEIALNYQLDFLQLHGDESPQLCKNLKERGYKILKAVSVFTESDLNQISDYEDKIDYFLFDTKGKNRGGNGVKFDWDILRNYSLKTPFLLSGGISLEDASAVSSLDLHKLEGVDINSGFESSPGNKKIEEVRAFIENV